mgnify:CR=1 FL=1
MYQLDKAGLFLFHLCSKKKTCSDIITLEGCSLTTLTKFSTLPGASFSAVFSFSNPDKQKSGSASFVNPQIRECSCTSSTPTKYGAVFRISMLRVLLSVNRTFPLRVLTLADCNKIPTYLQSSPKGQLISKCLLGAIVSTKKPTKFT